MPTRAMSKWVRGKRMAAAEQAVWRTVGRGPAVGDPFDTFRESRHLRLGVAVVGGVLDVGVVGGDPLQEDARLGRDRAGQRHRVLGLEPLPVGAGLELEVHARRAPLRPGGARQRRDGRRVVEGEAQVRGDGVREVLRRRVAEAEDGDVRADQARAAGCPRWRPRPRARRRRRGARPGRRGPRRGRRPPTSRRPRASPRPGVPGRRGRWRRAPRGRSRASSPFPEAIRRVGRRAAGPCRAFAECSPEGPPPRRSGRIPPCGEAVDPRGRDCYLLPSLHPSFPGRSAAW